MKLRKKKLYKAPSKKRKLQNNTTMKTWKHSEMMRTVNLRMRMRSSLWEKEKLLASLFQLALPYDHSLQNQVLAKPIFLEVFDHRLNCPIDQPDTKSLKRNLKENLKAQRSLEQLSDFLNEKLRMNAKQEKTWPGKSSLSRTWVLPSKISSGARSRTIY